MNLGERSKMIQGVSINMNNPDSYREIEKKFEKKINSLQKELSGYKVKEALSKSDFKYVLCTRKNGSKFIKVIYDSYDVNGWVEIARINMSKSQWVTERFSIEDLIAELKG